MPGLGPVLYVGSSETAGAEADCAAAAILIAPNWREAPAGRCLFVGADRLRRDGALAIDVSAGGLRVEGARSRNRGRPWTADPGARGPRWPNDGSGMVGDTGIEPVTSSM